MKLFSSKIFSFSKKKFKSNWFWIESFLKERGKIKAIVFANLAASLKKRIAKVFCWPKGGFPTTNIFLYLLNCCLSNLNQSWDCIPSLAGEISYAKQFDNWVEKLPFPAEGSMIQSYVSILDIELIHWIAISGLVKNLSKISFCP